MLVHNSFGAMIMPDSESLARLPYPTHDDDSGRLVVSHCGVPSPLLPARPHDRPAAASDSLRLFLDIVRHPHVFADGPAKTRPRLDESSEVAGWPHSQHVLDRTALARVPWSGRLEEPDFLGRIYDLRSARDILHDRLTDMTGTSAIRQGRAVFVSVTY